MFFLVKSSHPKHDAGDVVIDTDHVSEFCLAKQKSIYCVRFKVGGDSRVLEMHATEEKARDRISEFLTAAGQSTHIARLINCENAGEQDKSNDDDIDDKIEKLQALGELVKKLKS